MRQLALDLPALARDPAATHVEVVCQGAARRALAAWREWPGRILALVGPEGAGKTHLATLWALSTGGRFIDPNEADTAREAAVPLVLEDVDRAGMSDLRLLALIDAVRIGAAGPLLFTARAAPSSWPVGLADLISRLALTPAAAIEDPTDEDLAAVFAKTLGDRGVEAQGPLVDYVVRRIERSFAAVQSASQALDKIALERKQRITRKLAAEVWGDVAGASQDEAPEDMG